MVFLVGAVQFINIWDFVMVMPLGPDFARALDIPLSHLGLLGGAYTAAAAIAGIAGSTFLDRFDRRPALAVAMTGLVLGTIAGGLAWSFPTLLAARFLAGAFGGPATSLSLSIIADVVPPERRGKAMGAVMGAFSVASVIGVPLSLQLSVWGGWRLPFLVVGGLGLVVTASVAASLPEPPGPPHAPGGERRPAAPSVSSAGAHLVRDDGGDDGRWVPGHPGHLGIPPDQPRAAAEPAAVGVRHRRHRQLRHPPRGGQAGGPLRELPGGDRGLADPRRRLRRHVRPPTPRGVRRGDGDVDLPLLRALVPERELQHPRLAGVPEPRRARAVHVLPVRRAAPRERARCERLGTGAVRATRRQPGQRADARPDGDRPDAAPAPPALPRRARGSTAGPTSGNVARRASPGEWQPSRKKV